MRWIEPEEGRAEALKLVCNKASFAGSGLQRQCVDIHDNAPMVQTHYVTLFNSLWFPAHMRMHEKAEKASLNVLYLSCN